MQYTKEQAKMMALLVIMGGAVVILGFLYLVKPNFARMTQDRKQLKKMETEIATLGRSRVELAQVTEEKESLLATIDAGEKAVVWGMEKGSPLSDVFVPAATALSLMPAYGDQTTIPLQEYTERGPDGLQVTRHYDEVSRTLDTTSTDFFAFCRFLSIVEEGNAGLGVTHLEINTKDLDQKAKDEGRINGKVELRMVGVREGNPTEINVNVEGSKLFDVGSKRNPFGPPGGALADIEDPLLRVKAALMEIKVSGVWADSVLLELTEKGIDGKDVRRNLKMKQGDTTVIGGVRLEYVQGSNDRFEFIAREKKVRFVLETNWRGSVTTIKEEETK